MSKRKPSNRRKRFSGSTLRAEQNIINGRGRSYLEKQERERALVRSAATRMGVVIITGRKVGNA